MVEPSALTNVAPWVRLIKKEIECEPLSRLPSMFGACKATFSPPSAANRSVGKVGSMGT